MFGGSTSKVTGDVVGWICKYDSEECERLATCLHLNAMFEEKTLGFAPSSMVPSTLHLLTVFTFFTIMLCFRPCSVVSLNIFAIKWKVFGLLFDNLDKHY